MAHKQTAGRDNLGELAPTFAALNDDVLFGQVWSREGQMPARQRSLITCASLMSQGLFPQLEAHLRIAKANGVAKQELVETFTQLAFYAGWPKAWSAFGLLKDIYADVPEDTPDAGLFPLGSPADGPNFTGHAWLHMLTGPDNPLSAGNVTFAAGCYNRWHTHPAGQLLLVTAGHGWEQQQGKPARELHAGDVVECPAGVQHWHGAAQDSTLTHVAVTPVPAGQAAVEWLEFPSHSDYEQLD